MSIIRNVKGGGQTFFCPGCKIPHSVNTVQNGPKWMYNGDPIAPTFTPSILCRTGWSHVDPAEKDKICHSFVTAGRIQFLGDCTHTLANQTVDIPPWPYARGSYGGIDE